MSHALVDLRSRLTHLVEPAPVSSPLSLENLSGRMSELCGGPLGCTLTVAFRIVLEAQQRGEPVVWLTGRSTSFYPPDVAANGIDLNALAVVRLPEVADVPRAADQLARSGAFGLLVLDLGETPIPMPLQSRLLGLAQKHAIAIVCLTERQHQSASLGSLISLRGEAVRSNAGPGQFLCEVRITKDKRRAPGSVVRELYRGPAGLR